MKFADRYTLARAASRFVIAAVAVQYASDAGSAPLQLFLDFNDNSVPKGWAWTSQFGDAFVDGKMIAGPAYGGVQPGYNYIERPLLPGQAQSGIRASWDISLVGAQASATAVFGLALTETIGSNQRVFANLPLINAPSLGDNVYALNDHRAKQLTTTSLAPGLYHFDASLDRNGTSYSISSGGEVVSTVYIPSAKPADFSTVTGLQISVASFGPQVSVDNIFISDNTQRTFALLVGTSERKPTTNELTIRGDIEVDRIEKALEARGPQYIVKQLVSNIPESSVSPDQLANALDEIKSQMVSGDKLLLYFNAHGSSLLNGSVNDFGIGDEFIKLGSSEGDRLTDDKLAQLLLTFDPNGDFSKSIFFDVCHSGGFFEPGDPDEFGDLDLRQLKNVGIFAASREIFSTYGFVDGVDGQGNEIIKGIYTSAIVDAISDGYLETANPSQLHSFLSLRSQQIAAEKIQSSTDPIFVEFASGDRYFTLPTEIAPIFWSDGADVAIVSEPSQASLVVLTIAALTALRRRTHRAFAHDGSPLAPHRAV